MHETNFLEPKKIVGHGIVLVEVKAFGVLQILQLFQVNAVRLILPDNVLPTVEPENA